MTLSLKEGPKTVNIPIALLKRTKFPVDEFTQHIREMLQSALPPSADLNIEDPLRALGKRIGNSYWVGMDVFGTFDDERGTIRYTPSFDRNNSLFGDQAPERTRDLLTKTVLNFVDCQGDREAFSAKRVSDEAPSPEGIEVEKKPDPFLEFLQTLPAKLPAELLARVKNDERVGLYGGNFSLGLTTVDEILNDSLRRAVIAQGYAPDASVVILHTPIVPFAYDVETGNEIGNALEAYDIEREDLQAKWAKLLNMDAGDLQARILENLTSKNPQDVSGLRVMERRARDLAQKLMKKPPA